MQLTQDDINAIRTAGNLVGITRLMAHLGKSRSVYYNALRTRSGLNPAIMAKIRAIATSGTLQVQTQPIPPATQSPPQCTRGAIDGDCAISSAIDTAISEAISKLTDAQKIALYGYICKTYL